MIVRHLRDRFEVGDLVAASVVGTGVAYTLDPSGSNSDTAEPGAALDPAHHERSVGRGRLALTNVRGR